MKKFWKISLGLVLALVVLGGAGAYHERHNVRKVLLVHQHYHKKNVLSTNQIKLNLRPAISTKNTTATNKITAGYRQQLAQLTPGVAHAKVIVNPYETSPLSGLILVKTQAATKVKLTVHGDTPKTTLTKYLPKYRTNHAIGVLGLYANRTNRVTLTFTKKNGQKSYATYTMQTGKAPKEIGKNTLKTSHPKKMALGKGNNRLTFAVSSQGITYGLDAQGKIRWYSTNLISHVFKRLANNHLLILTMISAREL